MCSLTAQGKFDPTKLPHSASQTYLRATGPKNVHAPRTLHFLPPEQHQAQKLQHKAMLWQLVADYLSDVGWGEEEPSPQQAKSFLAMKSLQFGGREVKKQGGGGGEKGRRATFGNSTTQYHSLADSLSGRGQLPWKQKKRAVTVDMPVLPMNVLKSSPLTPPPINC